MVGGMSRRVDNGERQLVLYCVKPLAVGGNQTVVKLLFQRFEIARPAKQRQNLAKPVRPFVWVSALLAVASCFEKLHCQWMQHHFGGSYRQHLVDKSCVVVVSVGKHYIFDFLRVDIEFFNFFQKPLKSRIIPRINKRIPIVDFH